MFKRALSYAIFVLLETAVLTAQTIPSSLFTEFPALAVAPESHRDNAFDIGLRVSSNFDDNALNDNRNTQSNLLTAIEPHFSWTGLRPRGEWALNYSPGYAMSHQLPVYSSQSQHLDATFRWRPTKRFRVQFHNSFLESTNPFDRLRAVEPTASSTGVDQPNSSFTAQARTRSEQAGLDFLYATSPHGTIGAKSSFFNVNYSELKGSHLLGRASSITEQIFYSHHLTQHQWIGGEYSVQDLNAHNPRSQALVQSLFYTHSILLGPHMGLSWFGGPQYAAIREESVSARSVGGRGHWAGGATYSWNGNHNSLVAGFSRRISDGAGLTGIVRLSSAYAELRREITPRWSADVLLSYDHNKLLSATPSTLAYISGSAGLTHMLARGVSFEVRYWRVHDWTVGMLPGTSLADHNRISTALQYDFQSRLGR